MKAQTPFGELHIETEMVDVTSGLPRLDKNWRYTDGQGHEHYWRDGCPTLTEVVDERYWCGECSDYHFESHFECPICHETVRPGVTGPSMGREFAPGRTSYTLNGQPISEERAKEIIASMRQERRDG